MVLDRRRVVAERVGDDRNQSLVRSCSVPSRAARVLKTILSRSRKLDRECVCPGVTVEDPVAVGVGRREVAGERIARIAHGPLLLDRVA